MRVLLFGQSLRSLSVGLDHLPVLEEINSLPDLVGSQVSSRQNAEFPGQPYNEKLIKER